MILTCEQSALYWPKAILEIGFLNLPTESSANSAEALLERSYFFVHETNGIQDHLLSVKGAIRELSGVLIHMTKSVSTKGTVVQLYCLEPQSIVLQAPKQHEHFY